MGTRVEIAGSGTTGVVLLAGACHLSSQNSMLLNYYLNYDPQNCQNLTVVDDDVVVRLGYCCDFARMKSC